MKERLKTIDVPLTAADLTFLLDLLDREKDRAQAEPETYSWTEHQEALKDDLFGARGLLDMP